MPYRALQDMILNSEVKAGDVITPEQIAGRDPNVLIRLELVEYFVGEVPKTVIKAAHTETPIPQREAEEVFTPIAEEPKAEPVTATIEKNGVWFQVFVNGKKLFNSRNENEAKNFAKDFNSKL